MTKMLRTSCKKNKRLAGTSSITTWLVIALAAFTANLSLADESVRYRYKNAQGVPVISYTLPAKYAQNGYEILDRSGNVTKVVAPAPSEEDVAKASQERKTLAAYQILKRRYSSVTDIERAKQRKLKNIETNISILKGNITNLENGVDNLIKQAAEQERAGRKVQTSILNQLSDTKAELKISLDLLGYREQEYNNTVNKYDEDIATFVKGESIDKMRNEDSE